MPDEQKLIGCRNDAALYAGQNVHAIGNPDIQPARGIPHPVKNP
ncbi:hypothetical protein A1Q_0016 [Vibrio campbellii HY01]|nr:hypothetical protein A1Q_0016 [Vibrio campbellii HY01]